MKETSTNQVFILLLFAFLSQRSAFSQGPLTPPGAPAPTMKTLQQIEPRTPISSAPFIITDGGSYYLTTNLTVSSGSAITIAASGVSLDLNGFTISSTASPVGGIGIQLSTALHDITIVNGHIEGGVIYPSYSGTGFNHGIYYSGLQPVNVHVSNVSVSGCMISGIWVGTGNSSVVELCTVNIVGSYGIIASSVTRSTARYCGNTAITADNASDCYGWGSTSGPGINVYETANNCYGYIGGLRCSIANNCYGQSQFSAGLEAGSANNCYGISTYAAGLTAVNANNCYGESVTESGLVAAQTATGCYGLSDNSGDGLDAICAENCYGVSLGSGVGVFASSAVNCQGISTGGTGLYAAQTATGCYGQSSGIGNGVLAGSAENCQGVSSNNVGLYAVQTAIGCYGASTTDKGLQAITAVGCSGQSTSSNGLVAGSAENCQGVSVSGVGLNATQTATGCYGTSGDGDGLDAGSAENCQGISTNDNGLAVTKTAGGCSGQSVNGVGLVASNAENCWGNSTSGNGLNADTAVGCYGGSDTGIGLTARNANLCRGYITAPGHSPGILVIQLAIGCSGRSPTFPSLRVLEIANTCFGESGYVDNQCGHTFNMP